MAGGQGVLLDVSYCYKILRLKQWEVTESNPGRMTEGTDSLGMKLWETPPVKGLRLPEILAQGRKKYRMSHGGRDLQMLAKVT